MKHALITIGCTREYIDPVRYISNESSGRQDVFQNAKKKLLSKNCDYLILNFPTVENKIFNSKYNNGILIGRSGDFLNLGNVSKTIFANKIVKYISNRKN